MSALNSKLSQELVEQTLAEADHLRIDPSEIEVLHAYETVSGGFGTVSVGKHSDKLVAIKELRLVGSRQDRVRLACRFARELKVWAPLDHPNVLRLIGFHLSADMILAQFIAPFEQRGHIGQFMRGNEVDIPMKYSLAIDIARGLQYLHDLGICHGDLKPTNVLVNADTRAILCDFGLAKAISETGLASGMTTSKTLKMSLRYSSPELLNDLEPSHSFHSDIWALGCLFLEIIAGVAPYESIHRNERALLLAIARGQPPASTSALLHPKEFATLLDSCWNTRPVDRPPVSMCIGRLNAAQHLALPMRLQFAPDVRDEDPFPIHDDLWSRLCLHLGNPPNLRKLVSVPDEAVGLFSTVPVVLQFLGWLCLLPDTPVSSLSTALAFLKAAVKADKQSPRGWYLLGRAYMALDSHEAALNAYNVALKSHSNDPIFLCSKGFLNLFLGHHWVALESFAESIRADKSMSEAWYGRGVVYELHHKDIPGAIDAYQRAVDLEPQNGTYKARLTLLKTDLDVQGALPLPTLLDVRLTTSGLGFGPALPNHISEPKLSDHVPYKLFTWNDLFTPLSERPESWRNSSSFSTRSLEGAAKPSGGRSSSHSRLLQGSKGTHLGASTPNLSDITAPIAGYSNVRFSLKRRRKSFDAYRSSSPIGGRPAQIRKLVRG